MSHRDLPLACLVGAGASGITAAKALRDAGIPFDWFDASDRVGGNWAFRNPNGLSSSYDSLHIDTSRERMEYREFPMPRSLPDFPHVSQIEEYFNRYVDHFGLRPHITFRTRVERCTPTRAGLWEVDLRGDGARDGHEVRRYDALLVANGHHWDPCWPDPPIPGDFDGEVLHSHDYESNDQLADRRVVVLGIGNSAMDVAVQASYVGKKTVLATRRGAHVLPKHVFGKPVDQLPQPAFLPPAARGALFEAILRLYRGPVTRYGLPEPDFRIHQAHPTASSDLFARLAHGEIDVRPEIARFDGPRVVFADGTDVEADLVVLCTGYRITFPFFAEDLIAAPDNEIHLFHHLVDPRFDDLFFIGLLQPLGAIMPLAEAQGRWVARYLTGGYALPTAAEMDTWIARHAAKVRKRYVASTRHTIQVDFDDYLRALRREVAHGGRRAARRGRFLPVPAAAASDAEGVDASAAGNGAGSTRVGVRRDAP